MRLEGKVIIVVSTILFVIVGVMLSPQVTPYHDNTAIEPFYYEYDTFFNCTSLGFGFGGDFENVTLTWQTSAENGTIYFAVNSGDGNWFNTTNANGTIFLSRAYFLTFPYSTNTGGTGWRAVDVYIRPEHNGTLDYVEGADEFDYKLIIDGFIIRHHHDYGTQQLQRTSIVMFMYGIWIATIIVGLTPDRRE